MRWGGVRAAVRSNTHHLKYTIVGGGWVLLPALMIGDRDTRHPVHGGVGAIPASTCAKYGVPLVVCEVATLPNTPVDTPAPTTTSQRPPVLRLPAPAPPPPFLLPPRADDDDDDDDADGDALGLARVPPPAAAPAAYCTTACSAPTMAAPSLGSTLWYTGCCPAVLHTRLYSPMQRRSPGCGWRCKHWCG